MRISLQEVSQIMLTRAIFCGI